MAGKKNYELEILISGGTDASLSASIRKARKELDTLEQKAGISAKNVNDSFGGMSVKGIDALGSASDRFFSTMVKGSKLAAAGTAALLSASTAVSYTHLILGGLGDFEEVPENGEIKADLPRTELLPTRKLKTYGKQFSMTRQAFVNDDIGFLTRIPGLYAVKAKKTIDKQVYTLLYQNSKIFDGTPLFDDKKRCV